ncbi:MULTISPECIES: lipid-A-disaccharide synthase [Spiribacter]|uniref:lipid-A-disaccharide synthase n=1 Tax=Spiribacter TaxID=1335745 RepID=UPI0013304CD1|nr:MULTISPECIES: lipid-A-disaccharide synthase [Spiribacter]KAF0283335.1 lipid-A-disaccharide synthase [Spiribacter roseus]KAF0284844.1 lipid-A-disaccharide synthase [Spiribacter sp. SSL99]
MRIALVAGEPSGDFLGAGLIRALARRYPDARFEGVGGPDMQAAGLVSHHPLEALSVMGIVEVLGHLPRLLAIRRDLRRRWRADPPDLFIGIDAPDFNLGLERSLRWAGVPTVHYVSPTVWAWRSGRLRAIRRAVDRMLCIFPFEADYLQAQGVDARFVGHPLADAIDPAGTADAARESLGVAADETLIALLPGSRGSEIKALLPVFLDVAARLAEAAPQRRFVIPAATPALQARIEAALDGITPPMPIEVVAGQARTVLAAADAGLIASGTATLEAMLLHCPAVMAYRVNWLTAVLIRRSLRISHFAMPNLMAGEALMPEFVQDQATAENLATALTRLLDSPVQREAMARRFAALHRELRQDAGERAADAVGELLDGSPGPV